MSTRPFLNLQRGIWTALVTPFNDNGSVDFAGFRVLVERQLKAGVQALVPCGTTGESATLEDDEKVELVKICVELAQGQVPVIAGAGHNATHKAIACHQLMRQAGADAALHVTPYYNKPTQEGLFKHFKAITESSDLPVVLYNIPSRTAVDMSAATTLELAKAFPKIVGIKETSTDLARVQNMIEEVKAIRRDFLVLAGDDQLLLAYLAMKGDGVISTCSNFAPTLFCELFHKVGEGDYLGAQTRFSKLTRLVPAMFMTTNPIPLKTSLSFLGLIKNNFRLPLCAMSEAETQRLKADLTSQGWL